MTATAIIPAAGVGQRLEGRFGDRPKGLIEIGGVPLIGRSLALLRAHGVERTLIVVGHQADRYHEFAAGQPDVELVENPRYAETGSMTSLACALPRVEGDFWLLESDLLYEARALTALLSDGRPDLVLASDPTGASDEVWVDAPDGRLRGLSKDRGAIAEPVGEFVGITRVSAPLAQAMLAIHRTRMVEPGDRRLDYEIDGLVTAAATHPVAVVVVTDLVWGELDCDFHYRRLRDEVWPACREKERLPSEPGAS